MSYTASFFREALPEWKRKKEFVLARFLFREPSYYISAFCANLHIKANTVSYFSALIAIVGAICFLLPYYQIRILGATLVWLWSILDCVDGNLARTIEKQPFGTFADAISSYILVGLICTSIGVAVYHEGGIIIPPHHYWMIILGAYTSSCDTLMRLIYQKYKATEMDLAKQGILEISYDKRTDETQTGSWKVRLESWLGIDGLLNIGIFVATIFHGLDLILFYCALYYGGAFCASTIKIVRDAMRKAKCHSLQKS